MDIDTLAALLEPKSLITDSGDMAAYTTDLLGAGGQSVLGVARPDSVQDVSTIVRWCGQNDISIVPQGGLTGLCSGGIPLVEDSLMIMSLGRMDAVRDIDSLNNSMIVEAGAVLANIKAAADEVNRYFPLTHGGESSSQIGGNLSTNAGGNNALKYGTARDQVLGLEVVLPDGTIWNGLRRLRKNTAGYDLKHLFIGAEGTLGIITAVTLKLRSKPSVRETAFIAARSPQTALEFLRHLEHHVGDAISAFELLSAPALDRALTIPETQYPFQEKHDWVLLTEIESASERFDIKGALEDALEVAFETDLVIDAVIAQSPTQREKFWHLRESIALALIEEKSSLKTDTAVPVSAVPDFIREATDAVLQVLPNAVCLPFGHLGDGNVHFNVRKPDELTDEVFRNLWPDLSHAIEKAALALGGTISAEHGIGRLKQVDFGAFTDPTEFDLMSRLKETLDPRSIMNPGVLFPNKRQ